MQNTNHQGASAAIGATATPSRSSDLFNLFTYLLIYLSICLLHQIRSFHSSWAILRSSSIQDFKKKNRQNDIPNVKNNSTQLALAARGYRIILWRPSLVDMDVGPLREVRGGGIFEIFDMVNQLPSCLFFGFGWTTIFVKISTASGKVINGGTR